ncbi:hypothetical protein NOF55_08095 [Rhizobiaceae bacterium BDR2-2]|uniref:Uncharacterized protein n=1 Tax=Ectorhizobium quercum TaxID=2965071 RepID=A0AAE3N1L3_9HYPH|nr:hypothetical protein [Ectorhizobium quercum]MCX8997067.1 hypothetical protein [Ectorhizobium quercum]
MPTENAPREAPKATTIALQLGRILLSLPLAALSALFLALVIPLFAPGFFGSCFEGSCGYMALFVFTPVATLALTLVWWMALRRAGPLTCLILCFLLLLAAGYFIFPTALWLLGLAILLGSMVHLWWGHRDKGGNIRDILIVPRKRPDA